MAKKDRARIEHISDRDLARVQEVLSKIGGPHVVWGAKNVLDVWVAESRLEAERRTAHRLLLATWVLAVATIGLVAATVGLILVTVGE